MSSPTSPMSAFLQRLAAAVRDVVSRGEAVHLDMDDARELWIIQGFAWGTATYARRIKGVPPIDLDNLQPVEPATHEIVQVSPSDFARGCLILAGSPEQSGKMAELAALSPGCMDVRDVVGPSPWIGSNEGARVAWELMAKESSRMSMVAGLPELAPHHRALDKMLQGLALKCMRQCTALQDLLDKQPPSRKDL